MSGEALRMEMIARLDTADVTSGASEARREIGRMGDAARETARDIDAVALASGEAARAQTSAGTAFGRTAAASRQAGLQAANSNRLAAHEATNLSYQMQDIAVSLSSGQSPFMVMAQQGSQVAQIMGKRGLGQILPAIAGGIASLVNPTTLLFAGITAGGYVAYGIYSQLRGEVLSVDEALGRLDETLERLEAGYKGAAAAARGFLEQAAIPSLPETLADLQVRQAELSRLFGEETQSLFETGLLRISGRSGRGFGWDLREEFRALIQDLKSGDLSVREFAAAVAEIRLREDLPAPAKRLADDLLEATKDARQLEAGLKAVEEAMSSLGRLNESANGRVSGAFGLFEEKDALEKLRTDLEKLNRGTGSPKVPVPAKKPVTIDQGADARELLKTQDEQIARLRLEASLIGATDAVRRRALATLETELEIRKAGIDAQSKEADRIRENAAAIAEVTSELERSNEAWEAVKSTGERSIDTLVDKLSSGDFEGALKSIADDLTKQLLTLGAANPLKNALYNSGLPTLGDAGGVSGFFKSLLGGGPVTAGNMQVQAATVLVNGEPLSALSAFNNSPSAGNRALSLAADNSNVNSNISAGNGSVAAQAWNFFRGKGLKDYQAAAILGHMNAESAFNPMAIGDGGNAFGLFQHNDRRFKLFDFLGGRQNLGNVQGQLDFAWQELMGPENRAFKALLGSGNLREATAAFGGFERPSGFSWGNPEAMHNWTGRLQAAEEALTSFGGGLTSTSSSLTRLDGGLGQAVTSLANGSGSLANTAASFAGESQTLAGSLSKGLQSVFGGLGEAGAGGGGGLGGFFSSLLSGIGGLFGFDRGGPTGGGADSDVKGLVHANEYVFSADATRRIGLRTLDALHKGSLRGYRSGGFVTSYSRPAPSAANGNQAGTAPVSVSVHNYSGAEVDVEEDRDDRGGRSIRFVISEQVADAMTTPGGASQRTLRKTYGIRKKRVRR